MPRLKIIVAVHAVVLALAQLGVGFVPLGISTVWLVWAVASVALSQVILLSVYVGMLPGNILKKLLIALVGIAYIAACQTMGAGLRGGMTSPFSFGSLCLPFVGMDTGTFLFFAVLLACARKMIGAIRILEGPDPALLHTRPQFSLLALLLATSLACLVLGLVRSVRMAESHVTTLAHYLLFAVAFGGNVVATVWSTLAVGSIRWKLTVVVAVSLMLGLALGVSFRHDTVGWSLLAFTPLVTLIPTAIVGATLLCIRSLGFRLIKLPLEPVLGGGGVPTEPKDAGERG
jgi:hypothetical protein